MVEEVPGNLAGGERGHPINVDEAVGIDNQRDNQGNGQELEGAQPGGIAHNGLAPAAAPTGVSQFPIFGMDIGQQADGQNDQAGPGQPPAPGTEQEPGAVAEGG